MGKALIIAEKPSVASDIAKALGGFKKEQDYFESDQYVLSSAVGHLLEITAPEEYRGQARQMDLLEFACDSAAFRPQTDREERSPPQAPGPSSSNARMSIP